MIKSRWIFLLALAFQASVLSADSPATPQSADSPPPNIIVFLVDDLGYYDVGFNGSPVIKTPHLDRFAAEGVNYHAAYSASPICSPARASLLTGRFPNRVGVFDIVMNAHEVTMPHSEVTLAEMLRGAGYDTFYGGKWHVTNEHPIPAQKHGFDRGFHHYPGMAWTLVGEAIRWLGKRQDKERPFFLYLTPVEPHFPSAEWAPPPYRKHYESDHSAAAAREIPYRGCVRNRSDWDSRTAYFGAITQMDDAFGKLLEHLDREGLRQNTFILFMSDNGPASNGAEAFGSPGPFSGCKLTLYEGGIRVPAVAQWPGRMKSGLETDEPMHAVDVFPTLAEVSGADLPEDRTLDGVSFVPTLKGEKLERKTPLFWMFWAGQSRGMPTPIRGGMQAALREGDWKILGRLEPIPSRWTVREYMEKAQFDFYELYNLATDPTESHNVAEQHPEVLEDLKAKLIAVHQDSMSEAPDFDMEHRRFLAARKVDDAKISDP